MAGFRFVLAASLTVWAIFGVGFAEAAHHSSSSRESFHARMMRPLTGDEEARAIAFVRAFDPEQLPRFELLKTRAIKRYNLSVRKTLRLQKYLDKVHGREDSTVYAEEADAFRRMFRLSLDAEDIALRYRAASDEETRSRLRGELTSTLDEVFGIWEQVKRDEIRRMAAEVQRLRHIVEERERRRNAIVERRVRHMLRGAEEHK